MAHRGRTVLAMDCALAGAESHLGRPLNGIVRPQRHMNRTSLAIPIVAVVFSVPVFAESLLPVEIPPGHPTLYIYPETVTRSGAVVTLTYLVQTTSGSSTHDAVVDCAANTYSTRAVRIYSEPMGRGAARALSLREADQAAQPIEGMSTWAFVAKAVCK